MNGQTWLALMQAAVLAPWAIKYAEREPNAYFRIGVQVAAVSLIAYNAPAIVRAVSTWLHPPLAPPPQSK